MATLGMPQARAAARTPPESRALAGLLQLIGDGGLRKALAAQLEEVEAARAEVREALLAIDKHGEIDALHEAAASDREAASARLADAQNAVEEAERRSAAMVEERKEFLDRTAARLAEREGKIEARQAVLDAQAKDLEGREQAVARAQAALERAMKGAA